MKIRITFLLLLFLASSCDKEEMINNEFRVVVESTSDMSCGLPVIRFLDKDAEVKARTNLETLTYNAYHLDTSYNVVGKTLIVEFTQVADNDLRLCNHFGFNYHGISIVNARIAD